MTKTKQPHLRMKDILDSDSRVVRVALSPGCISTLTQVRRSFTVDDDLIPSIRAHGQQTPGLAAALGPTEARRYIAEINQIYKARHKLADLVPLTIDGKTLYLVLVAGHRRHAACLRINDLVARGEMEYTTEYQGLYRVELRFGLKAKEAIERQFNENRHMQVPLHDEARAAWDFYRWMQTQQEEPVSVTDFGRAIGRTPAWVRNALRFCNLPEKIQGYVDGSNGSQVKLPYTILVDLSRLAEGYQDITGEVFSVEAYEAWVRKAVIDRLDGSRFRKLVSEYLVAKTNERDNVPTLFGSPPDPTQDRRSTRRVVAPHLVRSAWAFERYLYTLMELERAGAFGKGGAFLGPESNKALLESYSPGSPVRIFLAIGARMTALRPHLLEWTRKEKGRGARKMMNLERPLEEVVRILALLHDMEVRVQQGPSG